MRMTQALKPAIASPISFTPSTSRSTVMIAACGGDRQRQDVADCLTHAANQARGLGSTVIRSG
jgi:hypothetical protein